MKAATKILGAVAAVTLGLAVAGCSSSSSPSSSPSATSSSAVVVTSLAAVCPQVEAAVASLPTGSVTNDQIAAFITKLNNFKAQVPPADQGAIAALATAYKQLEDANTQAEADAARQQVEAAATGLKTACATATNGG